MVLRKAQTRVPKNVNTPQMDALFRMRNSDAKPTFFWEPEYDTGTFYEMREKIVGGGTVTHKPLEDLVEFAVTTSGDKVTRQTRYHHHDASEATLVFATFEVVEANNSTIRVGYFDDQNGVFLKIDSNMNASIVLRSNVSGSVVDTEINQADWNLSNLEGFDFTNINSFLCEFQWMHACRLQVGLLVEGYPVYAHDIVASEITSNAFMTTLNLPIRWEIERNATTDTSGKLKQGSCAIVGAGGYDFLHGFPFSVDAFPHDASSSAIAIHSIRPKTTFNSITNRGLIIPKYVSMMTNKNSGYKIIYDADLNSPSFSSVDANSITEHDTAATTYSAGTVIRTGFIAANDAQIVPLDPKIFLDLDIDGTDQRTLSVLMDSFSGSATHYAAWNWEEIN